MAQSKILENDPDVIPVINNIIRIRKDHGYSQEYMAQQLQISVLTYGKIESRQTQLKADRITQIARVLGVDPIVLWFTDELPKNQHDCKMYYLQQKQLQLMEKIYDKFPQIFKLLEI